MTEHHRKMHYVVLMSGHGKQNFSCLHVLLLDYLGFWLTEVFGVRISEVLHKAWPGVGQLYWVK